MDPLKTLIIITLDGKPHFKHGSTRELTSREIAEVISEGLIAIDESKAQIFINHERVN